MSPENGEAAAAAARTRALRRTRAVRLARLLVVGVGLPTLAAVVYFGFWKAAQYESVTELAVRPAPDGEAALVAELVRSRATLERLARQDGLLEPWRNTTGDRWSRLEADAGPDRAYAYYLDKVRVSPPSRTGSVTLTVRAFAPEHAQELSRAIVRAVEAELVGGTVRSPAETLAAAEEGARAAGVRAERARLALASLEASGLAPDADEVVAARVERDLADRAYQAALDGVARARADAEREPRRLVALAGPSLPERATYPRRLWSIATVFVVSMALMGVFGLLLGAVREHAKF